MNLYLVCFLNLILCRERVGICIWMPNPSGSSKFELSFVIWGAFFCFSESLMA